jgi:hypothetical protein
MSSAELKRKILRLLREDDEFRYAVLGVAGYGELLRRAEEHDRKFEEILARLEEHDRKFTEIMARLEEHSRRFEEHDRKFNEITAILVEHGKRLDRHEEILAGLLTEVRRIHAGLESVSTTLQRLTISVEEEGASHIRHRLKEMYGVEVEIERIWVDGEEVNFYGAVQDLCVIGEATVRLGPGLVDELIRKVSDIKAKKPELLRPRLLKVVYADYATPDALEYARKNNVWVLKWSGSLTQPSVEEV